MAQLESASTDLGIVPAAQYGNNEIVAWIHSVNDTTDVNPLNDTIHFSFYICNTLIDSVNIVGTGETYPTIADVV